jgi:hypothetical protein
MAGERDEVELEMAMGVASMMVAMGRVPHPAAWVDSLIDAERANAMEGFF